MHLRPFLFIFSLAVAAISCNTGGSDQQESGADSTQVSTDQSTSINPHAMQGGATQVSDEDLTKIVELDKQLRPLQEAAQQEMMTALGNSGLEMQQYQSIAQMQQQGSTESVSDEEMQKYTALSAEIERIDQEMQNQAVTIMESEGYSLEQYQEVVMAIQQDPALMQKIQSMIQTAEGIE